MKTQIFISIKILLVIMFLTGILYPLFITGIARLVFPQKANGSIIVQNNKKYGSALIGQHFSSNRYFWPRPSAIDYNPMPSGGSNLSMTSQAMKQKADGLRIEFVKNNQLPVNTIVPNEMIFASGSGLDPHITVFAARLQAKRVASARGITETKVLEIIEEMKSGRQFGILGEPRINVLLLNLELDKHK